MLRRNVRKRIDEAIRLLTEMRNDILHEHAERRVHPLVEVVERQVDDASNASTVRQLWKREELMALRHQRAMSIERALRIGAGAGRVDDGRRIVRLHRTTQVAKQVGVVFLAERDEFVAEYRALLNDEEAMGVTGLVAPHAAFDRLAADLAPGCLLVVKQGVAGARAMIDGQSFAVAAPSVEVVDTVGAGDTFNAAFLAALARGTGIAEALRAGVECASRAISTFPRRYT